MSKRLYFGHPINIYNTKLEDQLLRQISEAFPDWEIENPNQKYHQEGYQHWEETTSNGMDYFMNEVLPNCHGGVFLPFRDGAWGAGVFKEAKFCAEHEYAIWKINIDGTIANLNLLTIQPLTIKETISRIETTSGETIPY